MATGYPLPIPPPARGMGRGTKVLLWSLGGCGIITVLLVVGAVIFGGVMINRMFNLQVGNVAAPHDFPVYPGAQSQAGMKMGAKNGTPSQSITLVQWQAPDGGDKVSAWYGQHLNQGDWEITDHIASQIHFRRRSTGAKAILQVTGQLTRSVVQLEMTGDQPLDAGATPVGTDTPAP